MSYDQRKYDPNRAKKKIIAINRGNNFSTFHALLAPHIVFSGTRQSEILMKVLERSNSRLSSATISLNVWRKVDKKSGKG